MRGIPRMQCCVEAIILSVAVGLTEPRIVSQLNTGNDYPGMDTELSIGTADKHAHDREKLIAVYCSCYRP